VDFVIGTVTVSRVHLKCKCIRRQIVLLNHNLTRCIGNVRHIHVRNSVVVEYPDTHLGSRVEPDTPLPHSIVAMTTCIIAFPITGLLEE